MIRVDKGEVKLDDHNLVIGPALSLSEFLAGDIPVLQKSGNKQHTGFFRFKGQIDGMPAVFWISFASDTLCDLRFWEDVVLYDQNMIERELMATAKRSHEAYIVELKKWTAITSQAKRKQMEKHDAWLERVIGAPPPYEYDNWGEIISGIDAREENVEILIRWRYAFGEDVDLKTYFQSRRERVHRQAMNPPRPFVPGQLPPGFSLKR